MEKQVIITLGREFGSGGHKIAQKIAQELDIPYYDRNIMDHMFDGNEKMKEFVEKFEEKVPKLFGSRRVRGYSNSSEEIVAELQFAFMREKAAAGESFVMVGRCAEYILRDYSNVISFFVLGDMYDKLQRVMDRCQLDERKALDKIQRHDRSRKKFHNTYSDMKWGDSRAYDLCVNASRLGLDKTADVLLAFINERKENF